MSTRLCIRCGVAQVLRPTMYHCQACYEAIVAAYRDAHPRARMAPEGDTQGRQKRR